MKRKKKSNAVSLLRLAPVLLRSCSFICSLLNSELTAWQDSLGQNQGGTRVFRPKANEELKPASRHTQERA